MRKFCRSRIAWRELCALLAFALTIQACSGTSPRVVKPGPLQSEGEVFVQLRPLPPQARGLHLEIEEISAVEKDGLSHPLTLRVPAISGTKAGAERLLALGRLEPGIYVGLSIRLRRTGTSDPAQEVRVDDGFHVESGRALVLSLRLRSDAADGAIGFDAAVPAKTLAQLTALCSSSGLHDLALFDKRALEISEVLPTGRAPWGVALDPVDNRAFVALSGEDRIAVIDVQSSATLTHVRLGVGDAPRDVALTPDRRLLVSANAGSNTVSFVDPVSMIELDRVRVGEEPTWLLIDRRGVRGYVFNARSNAFNVLDLANHAVVTTVTTEDRSLRGQLDRAGARLYVAQPHSAYLTVYSLPDLSVQRRVYVGIGVSALKVDPLTDLIYVGRRDENRLVVYDPFSYLPIDFIELPDAATYMAIDDAQNRLFVLMAESRSIAVIELSSRRLAGTLDVGDDARVVALMGERL